MAGAPDNGERDGGDDDDDDDDVGKRGHDRGDASRWSSRETRGMTSPCESVRDDRGLRELVQGRRAMGKGWRSDRERERERDRVEEEPAAG